jgi:hypothetical protein
LERSLERGNRLPERSSERGNIFSKRSSRNHWMWEIRSKSILREKKRNKFEPEERDREQFEFERYADKENFK